LYSYLALKIVNEVVMYGGRSKTETQKQGSDHYGMRHISKNLIVVPCLQIFADYDTSTRFIEITG
jgi:hypothetical protein